MNNNPPVSGMLHYKMETGLELLKSYCLVKDDWCTSAQDSRGSKDC